MLYLYYRKIQRQRKYLRNYKLCELVNVSYNISDCFLLLNLIKSLYKSPVGRATIITQSIDKIRLCFSMKVRFLDAFLALRRINHRQRMQKYMLLLLTYFMWRSSSHLFWLSGHFRREGASLR